ncbi:hypothetical protein ACE8FZ_03940 [Peribacillus frigoritolerans]
MFKRSKYDDVLNFHDTIPEENEINRLINYVESPSPELKGK